MIGEPQMADILTIVLENSQVILLVLSIVLALVAKYFQNQAKAFAEAAQAITDLSQEVLNDVKDGVVSQDELNSIVAKIVVAQKAIQAVIDILSAPTTVVEKISSIFVGFRTEATFAIRSTAQSMKLRRKH